MLFGRQIEHRDNSLYLSMACNFPILFIIVSLVFELYIINIRRSTILLCIDCMNE